MGDRQGDRIDIGARVPRWHNGFWYWVGSAILRAWGWRLNLVFPDEPKMVVIAAPHTSNWDMVFGVAAILRGQISLHWYAKHTLFAGIWGRFFRALGGFPIDRSAAGGVVGETARAFAAREQLMICITPEGTRSRREVWKRGFYHIALRAQVPVLVGYIDYARKEAGTAFSFMPTGDWDRDMAPVFEFYRGITAKRPQDFAVEAAPASAAPRR